MALMRDQLPSNAVWASFGISRFEFPMVASAVVLGGHVRGGGERHKKGGPGSVNQGRPFRVGCRPAVYCTPPKQRYLISR
ncbi:MAG: 3-keto-5-aminohexanoate cleavage protein [Alphaproteobacteria bacterium]|nr:3-keto-5-aminohexanoate cleavage protein [Alphaproteobacteria bacterium]